MGDWVNLHLAILLQLLAKPPQPDEAIRYYMVARALRPEAFVASINLGNALAVTGRYEEAIAVFEAALQLRPDHAWLLSNLSLAYTNVGQLDKALRAAQEAVRLSSDLAEARCNLGMVHGRRGAWQDAEAALGESIRLKPDLAEAHCQLGYVLGKQGKLDQAADSLRRAVTLQKDYAKAYHQLGLVWEAKRQPEQAITAFRQALRINPTYHQALYRLGLALQQQGNFPEATDALRRWHEIASGTPGWPRDQSVQVVERCQRLQQLDGRLQAILRGEGEPTTAAGWLDLASLCTIRKLPAAATRAYAKVLAASPEQGDAHRYDAACVAALAGCGQGKDAASLGEKERASLRGQSLKLLRHELVRGTEFLSANPDKARTTVTEMMRHWQLDADLAGVRQPDALSKLPEAERGDWRQLWSEVESLKQRAARDK